eukprot:COSAG05_NODE_20946_length_275_cov_1.181818_1_plen_41_part_01
MEAGGLVKTTQVIDHLDCGVVEHGSPGRIVEVRRADIFTRY